MNWVWKTIRGILIALGLLALICILVVSCTVSHVDDFLDNHGNGSFLLEENKTYDFSEEIHALHLEVAAAEITICQGDGFSVATNGKYIRCENLNGTLTIRETEEFSIFGRDVVTVAITIPAGTVFKRAELDTGAGDVYVEELRCGRLELDMGAGDWTINTLEVTDSAELNGGVGDFDINSGTVRNLDLDMGIGEVILRCRLQGESDIDMGTGSCTLELVGTREDYRITADTGIGEATLEREPIRDGVTYGTGESRIRIDGGIGEIVVKFVDPV